MTGGLGDGLRAMGGDDSGSLRNPNPQRNGHGLIQTAVIYRFHPATGLSHRRMQDAAVGVDYCDKEASCPEATTTLGWGGGR